MHVKGVGGAFESFDLPPGNLDGAGIKLLGKNGQRLFPLEARQ